MMEALCQAKLRIDNPTPELYSWCWKNLKVNNPDYYKREAMGKWTGGTPEHFDLWERIGNSVLIPFGCAKRLYNDFYGQIRFRTSYLLLRRIDYKSGIELYPYQENAVKTALGAKNGIIVMPCGAGKTQTALELISRIGGRTLWLTHTQDLLNQSMSRAKSVLGVDLRTYGTITGGKVNIGTGLTFATVQTLSRLDVAQYATEWDVVIVDECHKAVGSPTKVMQFYKVLSNLSCRYKIGLTATPKRADGMETAMFALLGEKIYEVTREEVSATTCPVIVKWVSTGFEPTMDIILTGDGTLDYAAFVTDLTHDQKRFDMVRETVLSTGGYALILGNRVEYLERMASSIDGAVCLSAMGNSKAAKAERKDVLRRLNNGDIKYVFATYQLAKEGLDVPNLRFVILATPEKDETTVIQAAGRVGRKASGKDFGTVIDFIDEFGMLKGWAKKRAGYYRKLDYQV